MRADACRDAAVQMPAHRDLLAGGLRVEVDEDVADAAAQLTEHRVRLGERRARGLQENRSRDVHDRQLRPVALEDRVALARCGLRIVRRAHDAGLPVEVLVRVAVAERVVPERDGVGSGGEQRLGDLLGDARAPGRVLPVDDDEVRALGFTQSGEEALHDLPAGAADDVADEEDPHTRRLCQRPRLGFGG
jgi:hypothetical protein